MKLHAHSKTRLVSSVRGIVAALLVYILAISEVGSGEDDPFLVPGPPIENFIPELGIITTLEAQRAFGIPEWSLDAWPEPIQEEIRIYFRPSRGERTSLIRLAIGTDACWLEMRTTSPTRGSTRWGPVEKRVAIRIAHSDKLQDIIQLATQEDLYRPPEGVELALLEDFTGGSIWILDFQSDRQRRTLIVKNVDLLPAPGENDWLDAIRDDAGFSRDYSHYKQIWDSLTQMVEAGLREGSGE